MASPKTRESSLAFLRRVATKQASQTDAQCYEEAKSQPDPQSDAKKKNGLGGEANDFLVVEKKEDIVRALQLQRDLNPYSAIEFCKEGPATLSNLTC